MKRIASNAIGIQQGSRVLFSDYVDGGVMWTGEGDRESRHHIKFDETFADVPVVMASIGMWDTDHMHNARAEIVAEKITAKGFQLVFRTWGDTRIARVRADWTAIGALKDEDDWDLS